MLIGINSVPSDNTPPDSDLLGLEVTAIAALLVLGTLAAFFFIGPVVGILVLIAVGTLGAYLAYRRFGSSGGDE